MVMVPLAGLASDIRSRAIVRAGQKGRVNRFRLSGVRVIWELRYKTPGKLPAKVLNRLAKQVNRRVLEIWHAEMRPKHFGMGAYSRYHYQQRTWYTREMKLKKYGHNRPIVKRSFTELALSKIVRLSATSRTARLLMRGPWYLGYRRRSERGVLSPDLKAEIREITQPEAQKLANIGSKLMAQGFRRFEGWEKRRVKFGAGRW